MLRLLTSVHCGIFALLLAFAAPAQALTAEQVRAMAIGESDERAAAIVQAAASADPQALEFFQALLDDAVKTAGDKVFVVRGDKARDAATGAEVSLPEGAEDVINSNRLRREIDTAIASLKLFSPDAAQRTAAVKELRDGVDETRLPLIDKALGAETDPALKVALELLRANILISSADNAQRLAAAKALAGSAHGATKTVLLDRLKPGVEADAQVRAQLRASLAQIESRLAWGERLGVVFTGVSLGSILLLVALGLAITYGLMGVINMAHGELMMIGAYATWLVQNVFRSLWPGAFDAYILAAIPLSFLAAALVGAALERSVIRWLYGRPLETLLATWGISLVLMQAVRSLFGAQNVQVENPAWLSGGVDVLSNLTLPYNRIAIIAFAALVLGAVALLIARTRLGLFVRGVTQNRPMAACMGVNTARVDTYAFALGSGIAGLAGCALSQVGNVGPDLGQGYIVDSFMVVVLGGVGQLAGTVYAALGLGVLNKLLEGWAGAVLAKIMVLVFIVIFIQKRPQGIFAMRGRSAEA
jgi:urea transport system permease protein